MLTLNLGLHKKRVVKFRADIMLEIVKTPIWLRIELTKTRSLFDRRKPKLMPRVNGKRIKGDQHFSCFTVNHNTKTSITSFLCTDGLAKALFGCGISLTRILLWPTVKGKKN